jgi:uncharacterized protein with GYD domain
MRAVPRTASGGSPGGSPDGEGTFDGTERVPGRLHAESVAAQIKEPHDRVEAVTPALEAMGGTIVAAGYPFGGYGAVILLEVPDDTTATGIGLAVAAGDAFSPTATITPAAHWLGVARVLAEGARFPTASPLITGRLPPAAGILAGAATNPAAPGPEVTHSCGRSGFAAPAQTAWLGAATIR